MKPQLAEDAIVEKVAFPAIYQHKIDGVRALNLKGTLTGRSLDPFEGFGITEYFSQPEFIGLDGEMVLGTNPASTERLCHLTSGAMGRFKDVTEMADFHWWLFDYVLPGTVCTPYKARHELLAEYLDRLQHERLHLVPAFYVEDRDHLNYLFSHSLDLGYEGGIVRNANEPYKEGRSDKRQQLVRMKPWQDDEMLCTGITEGERNENAAKTNTLGHTERSSAKAGKVPNGQVGSLQGVLLKDIYSKFTGKLLFPKDLPITIGSGKMSVKDATHYFQHPEEVVGHIIKFKHMTHGTKDVPRMGTFESIRLPQDMS